MFDARKSKPLKASDTVSSCHIFVRFKTGTTSLSDFLLVYVVLRDIVTSRELFICVAAVKHI